ncbi:hypothetical protein BDFB_012343 [Asbolus verrucosus]|uniref:Uncharacterized protein n=1 Tax=Asbolus verrucosus TaxID=1661398 RepID=A0A482WCV3_ASBVE|nr:hypothetical protein BDFB_012343 [Asbolus verrucosus]
MSNRYHNSFHHSSDSHFGSQFSSGFSQFGSHQDMKHADENSKSSLDLDQQYEGHFVPPHDVGFYHEGSREGWEHIKFCGYK